MYAVSPFSSLLIFTFFFSLPSNIQSSSSYENCAKRFNCGELRDVDYPFWGGERPLECGHPDFELECRHDGVATIAIKNVIYRVLEINNNMDEIKVARDDFFDGICTSKFVNTSIDDSLFEYTGGEYTNVTILYGCPPFSTAEDDLPLCRIHDVPHKNVGVVVGSEGPGACNKSVTVPVPGIEIERHKGINFSWLSDVIHEVGFKLKWKNVYWRCDSECKGTGEKCGYHSSLNNQTTCFCPGDKRYDRAICRPPPRENSNTVIPAKPKNSSNHVLRIVGIILAAFASVGIASALLFFGLKQRKKKLIAGSISKDLRTTSSSDGLPTPTTKFSRTTHSDPSSLSVDIERGRSMYFGVQVFTYEELEEATDNFDSSRELGDGGFGVVYKGNLRDGRVVAVKRLYEKSFKRVQQFINEVEMLARLRHQNLVSLYGCTSRRSQELLLVYEYISNGTIADHLHGNKANSSGFLTWPVRLRIAIESASALAYLHKSEIIHRDVKTNNILLDDDFRVKVADFGLSRLFPNDVTHVSTAPQGTPGYVDPEYYQCYQLTAKSDVYSFGVVLMELITSLEAVDISRHRHDINLSSMAIRKIQNHTLHELVDPCLGFETDCSVRRMTTLVAELAFRCLQQDRDMRPSMEEVVECLRAAEEDEVKRVKPEVVDFYSDDVGLLRSMPPPISPDSDQWAANHVAGANSY